MFLYNYTVVGIYFKVAARGLDDGFATPTKINLKQKINCISLILHFLIKNTNF